MAAKKRKSTKKSRGLRGGCGCGPSAPAIRGLRGDVGEHNRRYSVFHDYAQRHAEGAARGSGKAAKCEHAIEAFDNAVRAHTEAFWLAPERRRAAESMLNMSRQRVREICLGTSRSRA